MVKPEIPVNCSKVVAGDVQEIDKVKNSLSSWNNSISDDKMLRNVQNCAWLRDYFSDNLYISELERTFPLAFTFIVYDSPQQVLRLLRLLYRPQNSYCIHYDLKSKYKAFFRAIADCLDNVIVPSKIVNVVWGHYSILAAQMNCLTDLLQMRRWSTHKWRYVINICGKELPLTTGREMVSRLMKLRNHSSIVPYNAYNTDESKGRIRFPITLNKEGTKIVINYNKKLGRPPFNIKKEYFKSQSYVALSYQFAVYITEDPLAIRMHNFFKDCKNPEEHFYATLYMKPWVPGGYDENIKRFLFYNIESVFWRQAKHTCQGEMKHEICIVSVGDLKDVVGFWKNHFFHNKYFMEQDHVVMSCAEERIVERNRLEYQQECG